MKKIMGAVLMGVIILTAAGMAVSHAAQVSGTIQIVGSTTIQPLAEELAQAYMAKHKNVKIFVQGGGSGAGVKAALTGTADIGTCSRELEPTETGITATVIAKDGIAIIVNKSNPVPNLTIAQVQKIFSGSVANWKQVGGPNLPIVVVNREAGSGTRTAFEELVLKPAKLTNTSNCLVQASTGAVNQTVAITKEAIGYSSLADLDPSLNLKDVMVNGVKATVANILARKYPLQRPLLMLTKTAPTGAVKAFLAWIASPEGQNLVLKYHFISINEKK